MNTLPQAGPNQPPKPNHFIERTPLNEVEAALIELQEKTDEVGLLAYGQVLRGNLKAASDLGLEEMAVAAGELLQTSPLNLGETQTFVARYFYEDISKKSKLVYPVDSLYYTAYIEGVIEGVKPVMVQHPRVNRRGPKGFRLCAQVTATRIMGLTLQNGATYTIFVPIGEIQTEILAETAARERMDKECLEPAERPLN